MDTLFMTKTSEKPYPMGPHIPANALSPYVLRECGIMDKNYFETKAEKKRVLLTQARI